MDTPGLRRALRQRWPWLERTDIGPQAVEAGECDSCGAEARMVETCGPGAQRYLGRSCALAAGADAWCEGHQAEAEAALRWLADLPAEAGEIARVWWVATGEVRLDPALERTLRQLGALPDGFAQDGPSIGRDDS